MKTFKIHPVRLCLLLILSGWNAAFGSGYIFMKVSNELIPQRDPDTGLIVEEEWKDIPDFKGVYQISNYGRIKSLTRKTPNGVGMKTVNERIRSTHFSESLGYIVVTLKNTSLGRHSRYLIHRLVAQMFIYNPENKREVNHKDRNRQNAFIKNLEWTTSSENQKHSYVDSGRVGHWKGKASPSSKPVIAIKETCILEFTAFTQCAKHFGVCLNTIRNYEQKGWELNGYKFFHL